MMSIRALAFVAVAALATGRLLAPPTAKAKNATVMPHKNGTAAKNGTAPHKNASLVHKKALTPDEQIANLKQGLMSIEKLRGIFTAPDNNDPHTNVEQFAQGAMTTELSKKDSKVWSTIETMLGATQAVMGKMKGKNSTEQDKMMNDLEKDMNKQAVNLEVVNKKAGVLQEQHSEEYLLGVLMQHQKWPMEKQLNATRTFAVDCVAAQELLKHYNKSQPLAPQLAAIMDAKKSKAAAAEKKAAKMFIQLANTLHHTRR